MKIAQIVYATLVAAVLVACGSSSDESASAESVQRMPTSAAAPAQQVALGGRFEVTAEAPFEATAESAQLTCQSAFAASPFRAQWFDAESKVGILVTGFPLDDGSGDTRVDNFQLTSMAGSNQRNARLAEAQLKVSKVSQQGASAVYEVSASGKLMEGAGSFKASGTCRA